MLDDPVADRQAQAGPLDLGLGRIEGLKEQIHLLGPDADTGVADRHGDPLVFPPGADGDHPAGRRAGIGRVGQQVEKDLFDLVLNRHDLRQPFRIVQDYGNPFAAKIALLQQQQGIDGFLHIHHHLAA